MDNDSNHPITQLSLTQNLPTTHALIADLQTQGLAMKRGGAEHMMAHEDFNRNHDNEDLKRKTKQEEFKQDIEFLQSLPSKMKHRLIKRLKHLERHGAIKV